jgi:hypothetical protein
MLLVVALLAAGVFTGSSPVAAHHGAATFDITTDMTLTGTVTDWLWFNPHCFLKFDVKDESGKVTNWAVESGNPTDMTKRGWTRLSFRPGDAVTVVLQPAKSGTPVGRIRTVTVNGKTYQ